MNFIAVDVETTGKAAHNCDIIELGAVKYKEDGEKLETFSCLINIGYSLPQEIIDLTKITDILLKKKGVSPLEALTSFLLFIIPESGENTTLVAHNSVFDGAFIAYALRKNGLAVPDVEIWDSLNIARYYARNVQNHKLHTLIAQVDPNVKDFHRAFEDADSVRKIMTKYIEDNGLENVRKNAKAVSLKSFEKNIMTSLPLKFMPIGKNEKHFKMEKNGCERIFNDYEFIYAFTTSKGEQNLLVRSHGKFFAVPFEKVQFI